MKVFVNGGSGNGKSAYAEKIAAKFGGKMIYVATMPIYGEDDLKVVERHHKLRAGRGFETLERPKLLEDIPDNNETVLIECMSTHVANMMFGSGFEMLEGDLSINWAEKIWEEVEKVFNRSGNTIIVSAESTMDGFDYDPDTNEYRKVLAKINNKLAECADVYLEVVCSIPVVHKGSLGFMNE